MIMTILVDGKKLSLELRDSIKEYIIQQEKSPSLHIIYIGSDPVIDNFVKYKEIFGAFVGAEVVIHRLGADITLEDAIAYVEKHQQDADGVIIQLPLPEHLDRDMLLNSVDPGKDIDVLAEKTRNNFIQNKTDFFPPVTGAIAYIAQQHDVDFKSFKTLIVGNGTLVGHPTVLWMDREKYHYTLVDKQTDIYVLHQLMNDSDIIISGVGQPHMIKDFFIKEGVIIFDAGTSESGKKIIGDVHPGAIKKTSIMTPVPGGIGPLTIAILYNNLLHAAYADYDRNIYTNS
jgi:methylenetetrahydrofolate dehydrogenase (NADP+)/methenyltetrahydrofolate cyclohydrolase